MSEQPKYAQAPSLDKKAKAAGDPAGYLSRKPSWRIARMEFVDPFGWHVIDADSMRSIREKLASFETMTWASITVQGKKQNHTVAVKDLCALAQKRLRELKLDDLDGLLSLRLSGRQRVWGIFAEGVMTVLWWDPRHQVCPSLK